MRRVAAFALVIAVALGLAAAASAQTSAGSVSIRLTDAPSNRQDDPRARIYIVDHLHQGDQIVRHVELGNGTDQPVSMELYAAAATIKDGQWTVSDGRTADELSSWTKIEPATVQVGPHGTAVATVTVTIPKNAVDGERYAVLWTQPPASGGNVPVVNRVGIRMYVSVGEGAEPTTDFHIDALVASRDAQGRPVVSTKVTNTGGRAIDLSGQLQLSNGPGSLAAGPFPVQLGTTLKPGESAPATVQLDKNLPDGPWDATVTVASGEVSHKAKATITFPSTPGTSAKPVVAESVKRQRRVLIPVAGVLVASVLAGLGAYALQLRRRPKRAKVTSGS